MVYVLLLSVVIVLLNKVFYWVYGLQYYMWVVVVVFIGVKGEVWMYISVVMLVNVVYVNGFLCGQFVYLLNKQ